MLRIGIFGVGYLGKIHIEQLQKISEFTIVGFYDPDEKNASFAIENFQIARYYSTAELIKDCDVIDIVAPTKHHYRLAEEVIKSGRHVFIEKPFTQTVEEAEALCKMINEANIKCQIGHVERFNPAFIAVKPFISNPLFIEIHRLAQFTTRGSDVSVVLDLMIHDIDIVMSLVKSDLKRISVSGVKVISETSDIANVRMEFLNGCVANITSSRISLKKMRKIRIFQKDAYLSVDFLEKKYEYIKIKSESEPIGILDIPIDLADGTKKMISFESPEVPAINSILYELELFRDSILNNTPTEVSHEDGLRAVDVAHQILKKINEQAKE
jgi:predicted dehydrogenase